MSETRFAIRVYDPKNLDHLRLLVKVANACGVPGVSSTVVVHHAAPHDDRDWIEVSSKSVDRIGIGLAH